MDKEKFDFIIENFQAGQDVSIGLCESELFFLLETFNRFYQGKFEITISCFINKNFNGGLFYNQVMIKHS